MDYFALVDNDEGWVHVVNGQLEVANSVATPHEVGLTDLAVATLRNEGALSYVVSFSSKAESSSTGADLALIDRALSRILLYQAKIIDGEANGYFTLKSEVTASQLEKLRVPSIEISGQTFRVDALLALYQNQEHRCIKSEVKEYETATRSWHDSLGHSSPCGILASEIPKSSGSQSIDCESTRPWEELPDLWTPEDVPLPLSDFEQDRSQQLQLAQQVSDSLGTEDHDFIAAFLG